jgi:ATP-dependent DNA helicase DinG
VQVAHRKQAEKFQRRAYNRVKSHVARCKLIGTAPYLGTDGYVRIVNMVYGRAELEYKPISIANFMRQMFFDKGKSAVFVSATLPFKYMKKRLGVPDNTRFLAVDTPFPFKELGMLYVPKDLPDPKKQPNERAQAVADRILELVTASQGRALLLFTSRQQMDAVHGLIANKIGHTVLKQGDLPNKALAEQFRSDVNSVLFGMDSFMQGVDFQGETCSLVVIDKMPFPIFGDPLVEARRETIEFEAGDSFASYEQYMVPEMVIKLDQAMGRLIRKTTDKGVVAILDPRIRAQRNDWIFDELPPFRTVGSLAKVKEFLESI